ncbi:hypothetical protein GCM10027160_31480 [Streptomyces calidiresistens]
MSSGSCDPHRPHPTTRFRGGSHRNHTVLPSMAGDLFPDTEVEGGRFGAVFEQLRAQALGPTDSSRLLTTILDTDSPRR